MTRSQPAAAIDIEFMETLNSSLFAVKSFEEVKKQALELVRLYLRADGCLLLVSEAGGRGLTSIHHFADTLPETDPDQLRRGYFFDDPIIKVLTAQLKSSRFAAARLEDVDDLGGFLTSDTYRHVYVRHGMRQMLSGIVEPIESAAAVACFYRGDATHGFTGADVASVRALMPAFGNAIRRIILEQSILGRLGSRAVASDLTMKSLTEDHHLHRLLFQAGDSAALAAEAVYARHHVLDDEIDDAQARLDTLSERERQVAHMVTKGLTNAQIAGEAAISHRTVEIHVSSILRKVGLNNRTELSYLVNALNAGSHVVRARLAEERV